VRASLKPRSHFNSLLAVVMIGLVSIVGITLLFSSHAATTPPVIIPDTAYTIPSGAIFLATSGSDANAGSQASPVATLNRAVALAPAGGTIVVRAGTYRDWYTGGGSTYATINKSLTFQAYPHEQVWFDGTDVVSTGWTSDGAGHYRHTWSTPSFCSNGYYTFAWDAQPNPGNTGPCSHYDVSLDSQNLAAGDPQMMYLDDAYLHEVTSLAAVTSGTFYYAQDTAGQTGTIYIATNPSGHTVELAARPVALSLNGANTIVRGLGFRRYATNEYNGNITQGAIYSGGAASVFENDAFTENAGAGLALNPQSARVAG